MSSDIDNVLEDLRRTIREFKIIVLTGYILALLFGVTGNVIAYFITPFVQGYVVILSIVTLLFLAFIMVIKLWSYVKPRLSWNFRAHTILLINAVKGEVVWPPSIYYWPQIIAYDVFEALNKRGLIDKKKLQELPDIRTSKRHILMDFMEYILIKGLSYTSSNLVYGPFYGMKVKEYREQAVANMFKDNSILMNVLSITPKEITEHSLPQIIITLPEAFQLSVIDRSLDHVSLEIKSRYCSLRLNVHLSGWKSGLSMRAGPAPEIMGMPIDTTVHQEMYIKQLAEMVMVAFTLDINLMIKGFSSKFLLILKSDKALTHIEYAARLAKSLVEYFDWGVCAAKAKESRESNLYEVVKTIERRVEDLAEKLEELNRLIKEGKRY
ncbi:hypothetical protein DRJ17_07150 [Candidatus Woesearchaeota archaeon]|nr:MAG: hypothetical protein DRJ17_07150 [Candidatus Woesearchaeota archaeon]